jgi:hypothetical protein
MKMPKKTAFRCKMYYWTGHWFSPLSSTNKTDCHDITEILLKVALNTIPIITDLNFTD